VKNSVFTSLHSLYLDAETGFKTPEFYSKSCEMNKSLGAQAKNNSLGEKLWRVKLLFSFQRSKKDQNQGVDFDKEPLRRAISQKECLFAEEALSSNPRGCNPISGLSPA